MSAIAALVGSVFVWHLNCGEPIRLNWSSWHEQHIASGMGDKFDREDGCLGGGTGWLSWVSVGHCQNREEPSLSICPTLIFVCRNGGGERRELVDIRKHYFAAALSRAGASNTDYNHVIDRWNYFIIRTVLHKPITMYIAVHSRESARIMDRKLNSNPLKAIVDWIDKLSNSRVINGYPRSVLGLEKLVALVYDSLSGVRASLGGDGGTSGGDQSQEQANCTGNPGPECSFGPLASILSLIQRSPLYAKIILLRGLWGTAGIGINVGLWRRDRVRLWGFGLGLGAYAIAFVCTVFGT